MDEANDKQGKMEQPEGRDTPTLAEAAGGQILIYRDGALNLQVRLDGQTVWLTQKQLAELYRTTVPNINQHLKAVYEEGELAADPTIKQYLQVQSEGWRNARRDTGTDPWFPCPDHSLVSVHFPCVLFQQVKHRPFALVSSFDIRTSDFHRPGVAVKGGG